MLCSYKTYGIDTPVLERTISISLKQERLDAALRKIAQQGGFTFSYNPAIIDVNKIVSVTFSEKTIREILDELFDGDIDYKERKKYIILGKSKKRASSKDSRIITGYVTDRATGERIPDVTIYDPASLSSSVSDAYGFFKIKIRKPTPDLILTVNKQDYLDTMVVVPNRRGLIKISLKNKKEKMVTLADSVRVKWKRFFDNKIFLRKDVSRMNVRDTIYRRAQLSIVPFVGTNHLLSGNVINDYSFNIYAGYSLGVRKLELGGAFNIVRGDVKGIQAAGSFNGVYGKVKGLQMAGHTNANRDSVKGVQLAGLVNLNWNSAKSISAAGLLNITNNESRGVMLAGLANTTWGEQKGLHAAGAINLSKKNTGPWQLAGLLNFTGANARGAQLAGSVNFAAKTVNGVQAGGLLNFTGDTLHGAQLSGLLNYATRVKGLQLGLVNVSDTIIKGVPIGLLSFVLKGYHKIEISADEIFYTNVAFRTGVPKFYNIFTAGIKPEGGDKNYWSVGYGIGTAPRLNRRLSLNIDITANQVSKGNFTQAVNMINKLYVGVEFQANKTIGLILGVTLNDYITDTTYAGYSDVFTDYNPSIISNHTSDNNINQKLWLGAKIGVRFF